MNGSSGAATLLALLLLTHPAHAQSPDPPLDCDAFLPRDSTPYVLPYETGTERLASNTTGHYIEANGGVGLYAIDFPMPIGTPVVAARDGEVVAVRDTFVDGNGRDLHENFVFVRHEDGTVARYFHLTRDGALVGEGERVVAGQRIGLSGNTGRTAGPHLHFDVQTCGPNLPPDYNALPCGRTLPVTFRNTVAHACGLETGVTYPARPAEGMASGAAGPEVEAREVRDGAGRAGGQPGRPQETFPRPSDVESPEAIVSAMYASIQRAPGEDFQWDRMRSLFLPDALLIPNTEQTGGEGRVLTVEEFIDWIDANTTVGGPEDPGFQEEEIAHRLERFGDVAHVFSTYQKHFWEDDEILGRGVNSVQLLHRDGRWWIVSVAWDEESGAGPLPGRYLPGGPGR